MQHRLTNALLAVLLAAGTAGCVLEEDPDDFAEDREDVITVINPGGFDLGPDTSLVQPGLRTFTPSAMVVPTDPAAIELYAVSAGGLSRKIWRNNAWSCWRGFGNPAPDDVTVSPAAPVAPTTTSIAETNQGWDSSVRPLHFSTTAAGTARRSVVFGARVQDGAGVIAHPDIDFPTGFPFTPPPVVTRRSLTALPWQNRYFSGQVAVFEGGDVHQVFGSQMVNGAWTQFNSTDSPLLRLRRTAGGGATVTELRPPNTSIGIEQVVGSGSATRIRTSTGDKTFVFTSEQINSNDFLTGDVRMVSGSGETFAYGPSLGTPNGLIIGAPLAVGYQWNASAGAPGRINVFVTARANASTSFELREKSADNASFSGDWGNWGSPPDVSNRFFMTSSVVRWDGPSNVPGNLRIDLFGYSQSATGVAGRLLRFSWDGAWWDWDYPATAPDGGHVVTTSSAVVDGATSDRVATFVRSSTGRIYEYAYTDTPGGSPTAPQWTDLSKLELCPAS